MGTRFPWVVAAVVTVVGCGPEDGRVDETTPAVAQAGAPEGAADSYSRPSAEGGDLVRGDTVPGLPAWTREDWEVLRRTVAWAWENGIDRLPVGDRVARIGETFVGTAYLPQTLDPPGPERVVINLRALDCVTFVENMLALAHFVTAAPRDVLDRPELAMQGYQELITGIRYREGRLADYPSRLHYFSEWLSDNERKGLLELVTEELGGVVDAEPIGFMTNHRDAYRQLAAPAVYDEVGRMERRLSEARRYYVPEGELGAVASRIRTGDVIAATSTLAGLDVAHTGIALWRDGTLHLMHAPLVGESVQISRQTLPERLLGISSQDGVMVARPIEEVLADGA